MMAPFVAVGAIVLITAPLWRGKPQAGLKILILFLGMALFYAFGLPITQGYHFGCNSPDSGSQVRQFRLGIEMCKPMTEAETTTAAESKRAETAAAETAAAESQNPSAEQLKQEQETPAQKQAEGR